MSRTFFVALSGSDSDSGSRGKPWKTVDRANQQALTPGDSVLFHAEQTFAGTLLPVNSGTAKKPVTYGSYGAGRDRGLAGRATIAPGDGPGVRVAQPLSHVHFENLIFEGNWSTSTDSGPSKSIGIFFENPHHYKNISLENIDVWRFGSHGILIWGASEGFCISRCRVHHNRHDGIVMRPRNWIEISHKNSRISDCFAFHNTGLSNDAAEHSGSGILMGGIDGGVVERCVAHDNGLRGASKTGGPVGIWTWFSNKVTIENCESHRNGNAGANDGGGFDIDGGCTHCVIQHCYAHENEGPGFLVAAYAGSPAMRGNIIRHNVSLGDCTKPSRGGSLVIWNGQPLASAMEQTTIHGNIFSALHEVLHTYGTETTETIIRDNRFLIPRGKGKAMTLPVTGPGFTLKANRYFTRGSPLVFEYHKDLHCGFENLKKLRQEKGGWQETEKTLQRGFPHRPPTLDDPAAIEAFVVKFLRAHLKGERTDRLK